MAPMSHRRLAVMAESTPIQKTQLREAKAESPHKIKPYMGEGEEDPEQFFELFETRAAKYFLTTELLLVVIMKCLGDKVKHS